MCFDFLLFGRFKFIHDKWVEEFRLQGEVGRIKSESELESTLTLNKSLMTELLLSN